MNRYITTLLCTVTTILLTLGVYVVRSGRSPTPRLAYTLLISIMLPTILTLLITELRRWERPAVVALTYFALFMICVIAQGVLR